jgi:hypothetical protein
MKLLAVAPRGPKKDFIDVHELARQMPLADMLACYQRRFRLSEQGSSITSLRPTLPMPGAG